MEFLLTPGGCRLSLGVGAVFLRIGLGGIRVGWTLGDFLFHSMEGSIMGGEQVSSLLLLGGWLGAVRAFSMLLGFSCDAQRPLF